MLTDDDWLDVAGFAFAHRPLLAVIGSLNRLLFHCGLPLPALRARLQRQDEAEICAGLRLSGRKALLARAARRSGTGAAEPRRIAGGETASAGWGTAIFLTNSFS
ncbi:tRNA(Met) cytidine acetyltransferase TmcA [Raoultella planticola]|uniref:tRNA(Met) cytidine acetyltransferase TmcA n=1 Tax=Raoultella planticola TaxID=575 RepID=A0A485BZT3_RAOPL|nr:tRNA(Met) cytidine acetyltransferase TmcA [Raoultella planticola]